MVENTDQLFEQFKQYLSSENLRLTSERKEIARMIFKQEKQFEAEELLFKLRNENKNVSRATIYRTLELLVNGGLLQKLDFGDDYSLYQISSGDPHHSHLYCRQCGKVIQFEDEKIRELQDQICEEYKFEPVEYSQKIYGYCEHCR
ncbi:MAG: Fur family transcriptional regulator [bacterium]